MNLIKNFRGDKNLIFPFVVWLTPFAFVTVTVDELTGDVTVDGEWYQVAIDLIISLGLSRYWSCSNQLYEQTNFKTPVIF